MGTAGNEEDHISPASNGRSGALDTLDFGERNQSRGGRTVTLICGALTAILAASIWLLMRDFDKLGDSGRPGLPASPIAVDDASQPQSQTYIALNNQGQTIDVPALCRRGRTVVFYFNSENCPTCARMEPLVQLLSTRRQNLLFYRVDLDRAGAEGIDFHSPVGEQFDIESTPQFLIYQNGRVVAAGAEAKAKVRAWMQEARVVY